MAAPERKDERWPWDLPAGPQRRALMSEQGFNISPDDYSDDERAHFGEPGELVAQGTLPTA